MSSLVNNLNLILDVKNQIKEILNTDEEVFSYYPGLIEEAIASGGATGTIDITTNGTHNVSTYAYAYIAVPQQEVPVVPPGYTYVYGGKEIITNGNNVDVASYSYINVSVPAPEGWLYPSGYAYITTNGDFDIRAFDSVNVAVPQGGITPTGYTTITQNGQYDVTNKAYAYVTVSQPTGYAYITTNGDYDISSYSMVNVNVQGGAAVLGYANITTNGTTYASTYDLDGFAYVTVNVQGGGGTTYTIITKGSDLISEGGGTGGGDIWVGPADGTDVEVVGANYSIGSNYYLDSSMLSQLASIYPKSEDVLAPYEGSYLCACGLYPYSDQGVFAVVGASYLPDTSGPKRFTGKIYECGTGNPGTAFLPIVITNNDLSYVYNGGVGTKTVTITAPMETTVNVSSYASVSITAEIDWDYVASCGYTYTG